ncbi:hypothetical protein AJ80_08616 [Polytolypa hystricis UAMH7299]|uniref:Small ribosomal subunit protein uS9m n=1 Tax=Polytolypa hystricis (strain UAMH7299) TaxID=1447883 RepID=A0A2B7WX07_POLH7|nr:hypothetical protein AJ80_08616 [Polytolypa hystricis UAMH7299]
MAWQRPNSIARAVRVVQQTCQLDSQLVRNQFRSPFSAHHPTCITSTFCQQRLSSTASTELVVKAAPPIDLGKNPKAVPARIIPASPAYFSGTPKFLDHFLNLEYIRSKYAGVPTVSATEAPRVAWLRLSDFRNMVQEEVPAAKYKQLQKLLQRLNLMQPDMMPEEVKETLSIFTRPGDPYQQARDPPTLDENGRARGIGRRKTSSAVAWLVEGEGEVLVNDKSILQLFPRVHDRESALWPLRATNRLDKYNVFALVNGGGVTGQAEALTVAIGKALMVHEPALKPTLRRAGVVSTDPRQVERKKPGHLKARKMPAWVKR